MRFLTSGESHGKCLVGILEGMVANMDISISEINKELERRQRGYGRGKRMEIEKDKVEIISGIRNGKTTGGPIGIIIKNKDWQNWKEIMDIEKGHGRENFIPRPGHADLPGFIKYKYTGLRNVIERSSARETAMRVAIGNICKQFLKDFNINIFSRVIQVGKVKDKSTWDEVKRNYALIEKSEVRNFIKEKEIIKEIEKARKNGDTIGGIFEIIIEGVPPGLGSYVQWDRRLDAKISFYLMSIPAVKGINIGIGFEGIEKFGSQFHDEIYYDESKKIYRKTNNAGGIEGGITNGENIIIRCALKPIPTLKKPLNSVNIKTLKEEISIYERSDICVVFPASVIGENILSFLIADEILNKFGGDTIEDVKTNYNFYLKSISKYWSNKK
ncbi:MAG TPA: chorismate synthase [bacterium]|nr:chorismate synthase [bacterium]